MSASKVKNIPEISLRSYMESHPRGLGPKGAVSLLMPAALWLREMHQNGQAHLQISPDTIFVRNGAAVLVPPSESEAARYVSGFAAPEVYLGRGDDISIAADVYSLTAALYYAATGVVPENSLNRDKGAALVLPDSLTDEEFKTILRRGMALAKEDRFPSAQKLVHLLFPYNQMAVAPPPPAPRASAPKTTGSKKKTGVIAAVAVALVLALAVGGYFITYGMARSRAQEGDFSGAEELLLAPELTRKHDRQLIQFIQAGKFLDEGSYASAEANFEALSGYLNADEMYSETLYRRAAELAGDKEYKAAIALYEELGDYKDAAGLIRKAEYDWALALAAKKDYVGAFEKLQALGGYKDAADQLERLYEGLYEDGRTAYRGGDYDKAETLFACIPDYERSGDYLTLIRVRDSEDAEYYDELMGLFDFEDAAQLLLYNQSLAEEFLIGTWKTSDGYIRLVVEDDGDIKESLPCVLYGGCYYYIWNASEYVYKDADDEHQVDKTFTILSRNKMDVYCLADQTTYTLYRHS